MKIALQFLISTLIKSECTISNIRINHMVAEFSVAMYLSHTFIVMSVLSMCQVEKHFQFVLCVYFR